ncbi:MAG: hypothetical protein LF885_03015 [Rickettsia endosymbiont of Culicoides impunctatus]|nr:MAG: hypothetical protein LF885_03015 [Rickettsia endosymbiont of Culicoides impunctatus]
MSPYPFQLPLWRYLYSGGKKAIAFGIEGLVRILWVLTGSLLVLFEKLAFIGMSTLPIIKLK